MRYYTGHVDSTLNTKIMLFVLMNESNAIEIEKGIGSEVAQFCLSSTEKEP
jgi:hypothetical protein